MAMERKTLKSISEFSIFKYLLVFYLLFFILAIIGMGLIFIFVWLGFSATGADIGDMFQLIGINLEWIPGGPSAGMVLLIIGGLIGSVFYAAFGTIFMWLINIVLKISGGIEIRFFPAKAKSDKQPKAAEKTTS